MPPKVLDRSLCCMPVACTYPELELELQLVLDLELEPILTSTANL